MRRAVVDRGFVARDGGGVVSRAWMRETPDERHGAPARTQITAVVVVVVVVGVVRTRRRPSRARPGCGRRNASERIERGRRSAATKR